MKSVGWRFFFLNAFLSLGLAEEVVSPSDLKTIKDPVDYNKEISGRTGAVSEGVESAETVASSETKELPKTFGTSKGYQQSLDSERFPDQNEYEYVAKPNRNIQTASQMLTYNGVPSADLSANQVLVSGTDNQGLHLRTGNPNDGELGLINAYSRLIPYDEHILLHKIPGATNILICSREGELHNFWSADHQCLVCACVRDSGMLRPVCASCAGCRIPSPEPYTDMPLVTVVPATISPPNIEEVTCRPLPKGQPFENPLHPCQVCICIESVNAYGKPDVQIQCQENPQCVLPPDAPIIPIIPDNVPVHSHFCDKFPINVLFPHPSDSCKTCRCSVQMSPLGQPEKLVTCVPNPECTIIPDVPDVPVPSHFCDQFPLNVVFPLPSDSCKTCRCSVQLSQVGQPEKVMTCVLNPNCIPEIITEVPEPYPVTPEIIPITPEPYWPPVIPPGPLPGPSPHDSCRPYVPNQPFDHPWDECQMCVCTEAIAKKHVTVEISCFTKKSCCIESPFDGITSEPPQQLQFEDAMCEYKTFGVEFPHPKELCIVCTCEVQGRLITPFCKRSSNPECQLIDTYPTASSTVGELIQENNMNSLSASTLNNQGSSSQIEFSQSLVDRTRPSYNQWNLQKFNRPGGFRPLIRIPGGPFFPNPGESSLGYGLQNLQRPGIQFGNNQGVQNYYPGSGYSTRQGYAGYPAGFLPYSEATSPGQAQASASASAIASTGQNSYGYSPGSLFSGEQGQAYSGLKKKVKLQQFAQTSASAHASSSMTSTRFRGKSGNPDDNKPADNEN